MVITKALSSSDQILYRKNDLNTLIFIITLSDNVLKRRKYLCTMLRVLKIQQTFTKNLGKVKFLKFRSQLGLEFDVTHP